MAMQTTCGAPLI